MDPITITLTPRQALALRTCMEHAESFLVATGNSHRSTFQPFYEASKTYSSILSMLPSWTELAKEVRP